MADPGLCTIYQHFLRHFQELECHERGWFDINQDRNNWGWGGCCGNDAKISDSEYGDNFSTSGLTISFLKWTLFHLLISFLGGLVAELC